MYANKNFKRKGFFHNHTCWMASHNAVCPSMFFSSRFILVLFNNTCITASFLQNTEQCNGVLNIKIKIQILHNNLIGSEFYLLALFNMTTENDKITTNVVILSSSQNVAYGDLIYAWIAIKSMVYPEKVLWCTSSKKYE